MSYPTPGGPMQDSTWHQDVQIPTKVKKIQATTPSLE
jgi:hypothetical protein